MADVVTTTSIERLAGRIVVVKRRRGTPNAIATATEAEARWLAAAGNRGVVGLVRVDPEAGVVITGHGGLVTLRTGVVDPGVEIRALASVAATLAELGPRGLVHGNLDRDHVVLADPTGASTVLCSPAPEPIAGRDPETDVVALAAMAFELGRRWPRRSARRLDGIVAALTPSGGRPPGPARAARLLAELAGRW